MQNLSQAKKGKTYKICGYETFLPLKILRRLNDLGLTKGQQVRLLNCSLLKKALLIEVRGYLLSLQSSVAAGVLIS